MDSLTKPQRILCLEGFAKGYGCEDIAVEHGLPVKLVRAYMFALACDGVFDRIYRGSESPAPQ